MMCCVRCKPLYWVAAVALLVSTSVHASPYPEDHFGQHLQAIMAGIANPTDENVSNVVQQHMSEQMQALPMAAHQQFFQQMSAELGDFEVGEVQDQGPGSYYVDVKRNGDEPVRLLVEFDPNPPYGMIGIQPIPFIDMTALNIDDPAALDRALQSLAHGNQFSGALYIEDAGKTAFEGAYGDANKRYGVANTKRTRFPVGSITKAFTRLAVLLLHHRGQLELTDTIGNYIPELPAAMGEHITVWHLLRHQSGLTDYFGHPQYERDKRSYLDVTDYIPVIADLELEFAPGSARRYSNAGFVLLGVVIQRASGINYHDYIRQQVFAPAGMDDADFEQLTLVGKPYAVGYTNLSPLGPDQGFVRENTDILPGIGSPAGTAYCTIQDLLRFDDALWHGKVFPETVVKLFHSIEMAETIEAALAADWPAAFSAAGGQPGENALIISVPAKGRRVVVLSNYDERLAEDIGVHLYQQLKKQDIHTQL
ncbi:MAG: hypothetical protein DHS20C11_08330 [Lysobacteraceae bacterium]|nr:MAG: hypothetical protein DHS20C11_08330 [Xanthomonadaceae bacterium]